MKGHYHNCNMYGSLYGRQQDKRNRKKTDRGRREKDKKDLMASYDDLYRTQFVTMNRLFNKGR